MASRTDRRRTPAERTEPEIRRLADLRSRAERRLQELAQAVPKSSGSAADVDLHELRVYQAELEMQNEEMRRIQLELEESRDRFSRLYHQAPIGYFTLDAQGVIREVNSTAVRMLGVEHPRAVLGKKLSRFVAADSQDAFYLHCHLVLTSGTQQACECQMHRSDGTAFHGLLESVVEPVGPGGPLRSLVSLSDVTRRHQVEAALRESQGQLAGIFRSAMDAIITVDGGQRIVLCNEAADRMFGRPAGKLLGQSIDVLIPQSLRRGHAQNIQSFGRTAVTSRRMGAFDRVYGVRADGTTFPLEASISQVHVDGGRLYTVILRDISDRLEAEDAVRREKEFSESLIETAPIVVLVLDLEGRIVRFNRYLTEITGHRLEEVRGKDWFGMFLPAGDHDRIRKMFVRSLGGVRTQGYVNSILTKAGRERQIEWFDAPLRGADGALTGLLAVGRDVTERLQAEENLRRSEAELSDFFATSPMGLLWVGADGCILRVNRAQAEMLGHKVEEMLGSAVVDFHFDPDAANLVLGRLARKQTVLSFRARFRHQDGTVRYVLIDANGLWEKGRLVHSRWFVRDISARIALQNRLVEISEHETQRIGRDLHDSLGQHLHGMAYLTQLLRKDLAEQASPLVARADRLVTLQQEAVDLARDLARGLQPVTPVPEGLMVALRELAARTRRMYHFDCRFECRKPVLVENAMAAGHLFRIAQEAVNNAVKHAQPTQLRIMLSALPERIILGVKDNGTGFRPPSRRGRGMGLHIMQHRADAIDSSLVVQKPTRGGTEVICTVPRSVFSSGAKKTKPARGKSRDT